MSRQRPPLRILNYAVNGLGLGHLTRLIAINRQLRRLVSLTGTESEIVFLTSSEADTLAYHNGFAAFKIPSKSATTHCDLDPRRYRKLAKQWVWNAINLHSPDILIVDTFPAGSFQELYEVFDFGQKNVFIYRAVRPEAAREPAFQSALKAYDLILMPPEQGVNDSPLPDKVYHRAQPVGEILVRDKVEVLRREEARAILGIPSDATAIYISTGGGGDVAAETFFAQLPELARRMPETYFVVGAGALYRGREFLAPNLLWTRRYGMMELFAAFDAALTAGGFNSVCELLHVGVPCVFLPQPRSHDNQEERVQRCASAGAGIVLTETTPAAIQTSLQAVLSEREQFATAAATLVPRNHATDAAAAILALHLPAERVERAVELLLPERLAPYALWEKHFLRLVGWVATQDVDDVWEHAETLWQSLRAEGIPIEKIPTIARQQSA